MGFFLAHSEPLTSLPRASLARRPPPPPPPPAGMKKKTKPPPSHATGAAAPPRSTRFMIVRRCRSGTKSSAPAADIRGEATARVDGRSDGVGVATKAEADETRASEAASMTGDEGRGRR